MSKKIIGNYVEQDHCMLKTYLKLHDLISFYFRRSNDILLVEFLCGLTSLKFHKFWFERNVKHRISLSIFSAAHSFWSLNNVDKKCVRLSGTATEKVVEIRARRNSTRNSLHTANVSKFFLFLISKISRAKPFDQKKISFNN